ncbi:MAG: methyltransferase domain-containing protein [Rickettsiales bacterium]|nr:methyltransferase domain-containing protein [Rickettsiales bacterium]
MKFHKNLIEAIIDCLEDVFEGGFYADKVIERKFKQNKQFGSRDRAFVAENFYDIVRNFRLLYEIYEKIPNNRKAWQLLVLTHIYISKNQFVDIPEYQKIDVDFVNSRIVKLSKNPAVSTSFPDWLYKFCEKNLGGIWPETAIELSKTAPLVIRANTLKISPADLINELSKENIKAKIIEDDAILIPERVNLFKTNSFKLGYFEVQDYSSQQVAKSIDFKPNLRVVDACAGAGGKTLHLASLMKNKGKIIALDVDERKLTQLKLRARRAGACNIEMKLIEGTKTIKRLENSADILLLDVPCSGLGVLKRNPDSKWKLTSERIAELEKTQQEILQNYHSVLKKNGYLIYSTCSILPSENQLQIEKFLENNKDKFEFISDKKILPQDKGFDGFYIAKLRKL